MTDERYEWYKEEVKQWGPVITKQAAITLVTITKSLYLVLVRTKYVGCFVRDVDGYFYYDPSDERGLWSEYHLRLIADQLKELNAPWNEQIEQYFKEMKE